MKNLVFFLILSHFYVFAQTTKTITGNVVDHNNQATIGDVAYLIDSNGLIVAQDSVINQSFEIIFEDNTTGIESAPERVSAILSAEHLQSNPGSHFNFSFSIPNNNSRAFFINILGEKVYEFDIPSEGTYRGTWNGKLLSGATAASGLYILVITDGKNLISRKGILLNPTGAITTFSRAGEAKKGLQKVTVQNYKVLISGEDAVETYSQEIDLDSSDEFDLGTITVPRKPVASIFLYDLDSKYPEENNFQETTPNGVADLIIFDGNDLENWTTSDANGIAKLKFNDKTFTTLYVAGKDKNDTTYYFFKLEADINEYGEQEVKAFRDKTGIPIIKRETIDGWDVVEWMNWIGEVRLRPETYKGKEIFTTMRISDSKLPIKMYLDENNAPESYMPNQAKRAMDSLSHGRTQYIETTMPEEATGTMDYEATNRLGFTVRQYQYSEEKGWEIMSFQIQTGVPSNYASQDLFGLVVGHELATHAEKENGYGDDRNSTAGYYHSPNIKDISYAYPGTRLDDGITSFRSEKEKRENEILYKLPNGFLSLDIIKTDNKITEFFQNK